MKRNVISLLVAAMVLIGLIAFVTPTAEAADTDPILYHCICGNKWCSVADEAAEDAEITWKTGVENSCYTGCDGVIKTWTAWGSTSTTTGGYFYLIANATDVRPFNSAVDVYVDMNGYDWAITGDTRAANVGGGKHISVCNTKTTGGTISAKGYANNTGTVVKVYSSSSLSLYDVDVIANGTTNTTTGGGAVYVDNGCSFKMYGGSITGSTVTSKGGALHVAGTGTAELKDVSVSGGTAAYGGNIYVAASASVTLSGTTTVTGGNDTSNQGGNILADGIVTLKDDVVVSGGKHTGSSDNARNIRLMGVATAKLYMQDNAQVDAGITASSKSSIILSGNVQIHHNVDTTVGVSTNRTILLQDAVIDATGLESGARIATDYAAGTNVAKVADDADASILACFIAPSGKVAKFVEDGGVKYVQYGDPDNLYHCLCGNLHFDSAEDTEGNWKTGTSTHLGDCNGENKTWTAWIETSDSYSPGAGNYYLIATRTIRVTYNSAGVLNLDLNGYNIEAVGTGAAPLANVSSGTVNVCNSSTTASKIYGMDTRGSKSGGVVTNTSGTMNLYNVSVEATADSTITNGGAINVSGGTFKMYGGSIKGRIASTGGGAIYIANSGTSVLLKGVSVSGGSAKNGGNIHVADGAALAMYDCTISGGSATDGGGNMAVMGSVYAEGCTFTGGAAGTNGGSMYITGSGSATLKNGSVTGGSAGDGGNIYVNTSATLSVDGTTIGGGSATNAGGNLRIESNANAMTLTNAVIYGGSAKNGGSIMTYRDIIIDGGTVGINGSTNAGGSATDRGGNIFGNNATITIQNDAVIANGNATGNGGNIFINGTSFISVNASTIKEGIAANGGNVYLGASGNTLTMTNAAKVLHGNATTAGGNVYMAAGTTVTLEPGTDNGDNTTRIQDGYVHDGDWAGKGGNVYMAGGVLNVGQNARVSAGRAENGGNVYMADGELNLSGNGYIAAGGYTGSITNPTIVTTTAGNVYMDGGTLNMSDTSQIRYGYESSGGAQAGNVYLTEGSTLKMSGSSTIRNGLDGSAYRNVHIYGGTLEMSENSKIDGGVAAQAGSMKMSGNASIYFYYSQTLGSTTPAATNFNRTIYLANSVVIDATGLTSGARIDVSDMQTATNPVANISDPAVKTCFHGALNLQEKHVIAKTDNKIYLSDTAPVAEVSGYDFTAIGDAVTYADESKLVKLMATIDGANIAANTILDLNGNSLTNVTIPEGVTVTGMDSTTNLYDGSKCGTISGTISGTVAPTYTHNDGTNIRRYLAIENDGSYSFHRYYMAVTSVAVNPTSTAFTYEVAFLGDAAIAQAVADGKVEFGMAFKADSEGADWLYSEMDKTFAGGPYAEENLDHNTYRYGIANVLKVDADNATRATMEVMAKAYVKVNDDVVGESTEITRTFRQLVEKADAAWADGTLTSETLQTSLKNMYKTWETVMNSWSELTMINQA